MYAPALPRPLDRRRTSRRYSHDSSRAPILIFLCTAVLSIPGARMESHVLYPEPVTVEILPDGRSLPSVAVGSEAATLEQKENYHKEKENRLEDFNDVFGEDYFEDDEMELKEDYDGEELEENLKDDDDYHSGDNYGEELKEELEEYDDGYFDSEEDNDGYFDSEEFVTKDESLFAVKPIPVEIVTMLNPDRAPIEKPPHPYGLDISYPVHSFRTSLNFNGEYTGKNGAVGPNGVNVTYADDDSLPVNVSQQPPQPLGDRQSFYLNYMQGCRDYHNREGDFAPAPGAEVDGEKTGYLCDSTEDDRILMNKSQPASLMNFTDMGFKKMRAPPLLVELLTSFWKENLDKQRGEEWFTGNIYTNHWEAPTRMISIENTQLKGQAGLKQRVWDAARDAIEDWTGQKLHPVSLYGIRIYPSGAVLAPHVDRLPLVSSAIINVAQDVDEDWPIEVCGHDGKMHNVTMEPGDLVLYESHTVVHGRPFPLKGRFYANVFIHFEPVGHVLREYTKESMDGEGNISAKKIAFEVPKYILPGTEGEKEWHKKGAISVEEPDVTDNSGANAFHHQARLGDTYKLQKLINKVPEWCDVQDYNGWSPLHEAARSGSIENIKMLLGEPCKASVFVVTKGGASPYDIAVEFAGLDSAAALHLQEAMLGRL